MTRLGLSAGYTRSCASRYGSHSSRISRILLHSTKECLDRRWFIRVAIRPLLFPSISRDFHHNWRTRSLSITTSTFHGPLLFSHTPFWSTKRTLLVNNRINAYQSRQGTLAAIKSQSSTWPDDCHQPAAWPIGCCPNWFWTPRHAERNMFGDYIRNSW